jgi:hypothetical protein
MTGKKMTQAERDARNETAFCWKDGDLLFLDPNTKEWLGGEKFLRRYGEAIAAKRDEDLGYENA